MKNVFLTLLCIAVFNLAYTQNCPSILVLPFTDEVTSGDTIIFTASTKNLKTNVSYNWTVNKGQIVAGQGTAQIKVATTNVEADDWVWAALKLNGLPAACVDTASAYVSIVSGSQLVVSGTFNNGAVLKNAVQQFIASTYFTDPEYSHTNAYVLLYKGTTTTDAAMQIFKDVIKNTFESNKVNQVRFQIVEGPAKKLSTYEIYLLEKGSKPPIPSK